MKIKQLIDLLREMNPEAAVVVADHIPSRKAEFLADYGFAPTFMLCQHDDGEVMVIAPADSRREVEQMVRRDDRYKPISRGCSG